MSKETTVVHELVAHFLKENNYVDTLDQFEKEHGKQIVPNALNEVESLELIVEDRLNFNLLQDRLKNTSIDTGIYGELPVGLKQLVSERFESWPVPYPHVPHALDTKSLIISSAYDPYNGSVYFSSNDSKIIIVKDGVVVKTERFLEIVKKVLVVDETRVALIGMSGTMYLKRSGSLELVSEFSTGSRFIVDAQHIKYKGVDYIVLLAWNNVLKLFKIDNGKDNGNDQSEQSKLVSEMKLNQQGTCFSVVEYQGQLVLVLGKLESTLLEVYTLQDDTEFQLRYKISINDAEFTASSFSPRCIIVTPSRDLGTVPLIAVATSHEPYMRIIVVSLIEFGAASSASNSISRNQIVRNFNTLAPQDKFSQPKIAWRLEKGRENEGKNENQKENENVDRKRERDVCGLWVMGDDGVMRGLDVVESKVVVELKREDLAKQNSIGHSGKIREFITYIDEKGGENVISAGLDRQIIRWSIE